MKRQSGEVTHPRLPGRHEHLCYGFDDRADFRTAAVSFLDAGLAAGQRAWYVGAPEDGVHTALTAPRPGAVELVPFDAHYAAGSHLAPHEQVEAYATATADAIAAGFTGLRVATDVTPLVDTPARLDATARYEHLADHLMVRAPLSGMCGYDRTVLGADALAQLASMHPATTTSATPFRLHAGTTPGCAATIAGELDVESAELLDLALNRAELRSVDGELVLDAAELHFIDLARLTTLAEHARHLGARLVLRSDQQVLHRLVRLVDWDDVRIEAAA